MNEGKDEKISSSFISYITLIRTLLEKYLVVIADCSSSNIIYLQAAIANKFDQLVRYSPFP